MIRALAGLLFCAALSASPPGGQAAEASSYDVTAAEQAEIITVSDMVGIMDLLEIMDLPSEDEAGYKEIGDETEDFGYAGGDGAIAGDASGEGR